MKIRFRSLLAAAAAALLGAGGLFVSGASAGERVRVTAQLIDSETGGHIWAEQYDRPQDELFDIQDELVMEIAAALGDAVNRAELTRARRNPKSVSAWEEAMRALIAQERPTVQTIPAALAHARKSIELDPNFALAFTNRGVARNGLKDHDGAIKDHSEAIRLDPKNAKAHTNRGVAKNALKDHGGAINDHTEALRIDPTDAKAYYNRGYAKHDLKDFDGAIKDLTKAIGIDPNYAAAYWNRGMAYKSIGDQTQANTDFARARKLDAKVGK